MYVCVRYLYNRAVLTPAESLVPNTEVIYFFFISDGLALIGIGSTVLYRVTLLPWHGIINYLEPHS